jgi:hypothetical protein
LGKDLDLYPRVSKLNQDAKTALTVTIPEKNNRHNSRYIPFTVSHLSFQSQRHETFDIKKIVGWYDKVAPV